MTDIQQFKNGSGSEVTIVNTGPSASRQQSTNAGNDIVTLTVNGIETQVSASDARFMADAQRELEKSRRAEVPEITTGDEPFKWSSGDNRPPMSPEFNNQHFLRNQEASLVTEMQGLQAEMAKHSGDLPSWLALKVDNYNRRAAQHEAQKKESDQRHNEWVAQGKPSGVPQPVSNQAELDEVTRHVQELQNKYRVTFETDANGHTQIVQRRRVI